MVKIVIIACLTSILIAGISIGHPNTDNPFIKENDDIYFEGWYEVDGDGNLKGALLIDIINGGSSDLRQIDYRGIPDFYECSTKPANWICRHNPRTGTVSFIIQSGTFKPQNRVTFKVEYKNPKTKILTDHGSITYNNSGNKNKIPGVTRIELKP